MAVTLRTATVNDTEKLLQFVDQAGLPSSGIKGWIENYLIVENEHREMIGTVGLEKVKNDGLLRSFVLKQEYSNETLFLRLIREILLYSKEKGVHTLYLLTRAPYLFEALSFEQVPTEQTPEHIENTLHYQNLAKEEVVLLSYQF
ncbi:hypothetical protein WD019_10405 [Fictibacillus sp. Mic-4]|uniref:GNAT family N-acetyltransferase n=1 Tax=Fictibacillus sp. Mic-4 TaxID=3132826 RepID=UPI003CF00D0D